MCTQNCLGLIRETVANFVDVDQLFTAFDVSRHVQKILGDADANASFEHHRDMKGQIHQEIEKYTASGEYLRVLHDVGAPTKAFLYHPPGTDPNDYVPMDRNKSVNLAKVAQVIQQVPIPDKDEDEGDEQDTGRLPDGRGTLCVPNHVLRAAGFEHKDVAYAEDDLDEDGKHIVVLKKRSTDPVACYTVDYCDNVRVTKSTLIDANLDDGGKGYDFHRSLDKVIIQVHEQSALQT